MENFKEKYLNHDSKVVVTSREDGVVEFYMFVRNEAHPRKLVKGSRAFELWIRDKGYKKA